MGNNNSYNTNVKTSFFLLVLLLLLFHRVIGKNEGVAFSYIEGTGRGPSRWGKLDPNWSVCGVGKLQSPIDLHHHELKVVANFGHFQSHYQAANATILSRGRDILVTWKGEAGKMKINGTDYNLQQCHWHTPSEHIFNGQRYEMELHIVHANSDGEVAVVAILYKFGHSDPFLSTLFPYIKSATKQEKDMGIVDPKKIFSGKYNTKFYRYIGSLSVPPCTEGVRWTVLHQVRTASKEQVQALKEAVDNGFEANARPIQQRHGRTVYFYKNWDILNFGGGDEGEN